MYASSVSPERCDVITPQPFCLLNLTASIDALYDGTNTKFYSIGYAKAVNQLGLGLWLFTTINITLGIFNLIEGQKKITLGCKAMEWNAEQLDKTSVPLCFLGYQWFHNLSKYNQDELYNMLEIISKDFADKEGLEIVKKKVNASSVYISTYS